MCRHWSLRLTMTLEIRHCEFACLRSRQRKRGNPRTTTLALRSTGIASVPHGDKPAMKMFSP